MPDISDIYDEYGPFGPKLTVPEKIKFTCPKTGKPLSKAFEDMSVGEYFDETGIDLLFQAIIGMSGGIVRPTGER